MANGSANDIDISSTNSGTINTIYLVEESSSTQVKKETQDLEDEALFKSSSAVPYFLNLEHKIKETKDSYDDNHIDSIEETMTLDKEVKYSSTLPKFLNLEGKIKEIQDADGVYIDIKEEPMAADGDNALGSILESVKIKKETPDEIEPCYEMTKRDETPAMQFVLHNRVHAGEHKKKWNGIRDSRRRARQKRTTKSRQTATASNKYKFEDILKFLIPLLAEERKGFSNIPNEDIDATNGSKQPNHLQETMPDNLNVRGSEEALPPPTPPSCRVSVDRGPLSGTKRKERLTNKAKPQESATSQLMAYLLAKRKQESHQSNGQHPVDVFMAGIALSLKSLDPFRLLAAKGKIFNIVQEYELEQHRDNSQRQCTMGYGDNLTLDTPPCTGVEEERSFDGPGHAHTNVSHYEM